MNKPLLYSKYNHLSRIDAVYVINTYFKLIKWKRNGGDVILDVGCGSGDILNNIVLPAVPKDAKKIIAIDISEKMLSFAKDNFKNSKISYEQMDITTNKVSLEFQECFDHVISFYCMHLVQDHCKALSNIFKMLKPRGDVLLMLFESHPICSTYEPLYNNEQWKPYMKGFDKYVPTFQYSKNAEQWYRKFLKDAGFKVNLCNVEHRTYVYPTWNIFLKSCVGVNPFYKNIPTDLKKDYISDWTKVIENMNIFGNSGENLVLPYSTLFVHANKEN